MKKYFFPVVLVMLFFAFGVSGFISILQAAEIVFVEGSAQVQSTDKVWKKAEQGMKINIGDSVRTARKSRADIVLDEEKKNMLRIDQRTMVVLNSTEPGLINKIDLSNGKVYSNIENVKAGLAFEISTPSAVAGVRGTGWSVESVRKVDEVATFKDEVYVKTFDANKNVISEITIPEGFKTVIERFQEAGALVQVSVQETQKWNEVKQEVSQHVENPPPPPAPKEEKTPEARENMQIIQETTQLQQDIVKEVGESKWQIEEQGTEEDISEIRDRDATTTCTEGGHSG